MGNHEEIALVAKDTFYDQSPAIRRRGQAERGQKCPTIPHRQAEKYYGEGEKPGYFSRGLREQSTKDTLATKDTFLQGEVYKQAETPKLRARAAIIISYDILYVWYPSERLISAHTTLEQHSVTSTSL